MFFLTAFRLSAPLSSLDPKDAHSVKTWVQGVGESSVSFPSGASIFPCPFFSFSTACVFICGSKQSNFTIHHVKDVCYTFSEAIYLKKIKFLGITASLHKLAAGRKLAAIIIF